MKIYLITLYIVFFNIFYSQQIVLNSQYMINSLVLNPAAAGTKTYAPLVIGVRKQWMGIVEAPVSQHLSYHTSINKNIGVGGILFNDVAGPSRRSGILGILSTQIETSKYTRVSFALAGSLNQYMINREQLITEEKGDNTVFYYTSNRLIPDIGFGLKWYGDRYQIGFSGFNMIQTNVDITNIITPVTNNLERTFYLNGSYIIPLGKFQPLISLEPSSVIRIMLNAPPQLDMNLRAIYNKRFWIGTSYRFRESIVLMVGFSTAKLGISYSYDYSTSALTEFNTGSHEIMVTLRSKNKRGNSTASGRRFNSYDCPTF